MRCSNVKQNRIVVLGLASAMLVAAVVPAANAADSNLTVRDVAQAAPAGQNGSRIIVRFKDGVAASRSSAAKLQSAKAAFSRAKLANVRTAAGTTVALNAAHVRTLGTGADLLKLSLKMSDAQLQQIVSALAADPNVEYAQVDTRKQIVRDFRAPQSMVASALKAAGNVSPAFTPDDPRYATHQWHFNNTAGGVRAGEAWDISKGAGTIVAVLDTGILRNHPDMAGPRILQGYDFITDAFVSRRATDERVPGGDDLGDWNPVAGECYAGSPVTESSWHGTHVSGTVGEVTNNGIGGAGLAHEAQILPVRVLGRCGGYTSDIVDAVTWASGGTVADVPTLAEPADVINLSLGGSGACEPAEQAAFNAARSRGVVVVIAAGNSNGDATNFSPGNCANVINVGATGITGARASYSNYGAPVDLSGPGGGGGADPGNGGWDGYVFQAASLAPTTPESGAYGYGGYAGTSMASPHVAAVAAMVQSALVAQDRAPLTPAEMEDLLKATARPFPIAPPANRAIGSGIVNAKAALDKALEVPCVPTPEVPCEPTAIALTNKVPLNGTSGAAGSETLYSFEATAGGTVSFMTYGGSGDVSVYVSFGDEPTPTDADASSTRPGNTETIRFTPAQAGKYYIKVVGVRAYSNLTVTARQ